MIMNIIRIEQKYQQYGGIWCKESEYEREIVYFKLIKTNENNKYYLIV